MTQITIVLALYIIFVLLLLAIAIFLLWELYKADKVAKRFILSLFMYFIALSFANMFQVYEYIIDFQNGVTNIDNQKVNSIPLFILTIFGSLYLIYQIEKNFFPKTEILSKYHILFGFYTIIFIIFIIVVSNMIITDPTSIENFGMDTFGAILYLPHIALLMMFILIFFVVGMRSTGKYRLYAFMISLGWGINQISNGFHQLLPPEYLIDTTTIIFFIGKYVGTILTAYGFVKLYALKKI
jgi:hypothetical protein